MKSVIVFDFSFKCSLSLNLTMLPNSGFQSLVTKPAQWPIKTSPMTNKASQSPVQYQSSK
uniref:Uncharacterized protein n=1 Tax=Anguilla anguilla TaxID=7936 RepID=A0A0E9WLP7_ANGAN